MATGMSERPRGCRRVTDRRPALPAQTAKLQQQPDPLKGPVKARAEVIEYHKIEERIHLISNAHIEQDGSTVTGQSINYYVAEQKIMADSDTSDESDRVEVVIPSQALQKDKEESGPAKGK